MVMLTIENLEKKFIGHNREEVKAIDKMSFEIKKGEIFTLLGPSGCGKTTLLRSIAGLEQPDSGIIRLGTTDIYNSYEKILVPPNKRNIGMVFQSYAIWPHMTVFNNVAYPLKVSKQVKYSKSEIKEKVMNALEKVQLGGFSDRPATRLSGGQQQRLAIARAILTEPDLILLDEPLSNLDAKLREYMRFELKLLQRELGITMVYVTHDQVEALALSNEIAVLNGGKIVQQGDPLTIYNAPQTEFVADFIGTTNLIRGIAKNGAAPKEENIVETEQGVIHSSPVRDISPQDEVVVSIRPEDIQLYSSNEANTQKKVEQSKNHLHGRVLNKVFIGDAIDYIIQIDNQEIRAKTHQDQNYELNAEVLLSFDRCLTIPR